MSGRAIAVLLVDDHALFREGLAEILAADEGVRVVGEAEDGWGAIKLAQAIRPDVVLLDVEMPGVGAEEAIGPILRASPSSKVVILTMHDEAHLVRSLLELGASGYVVKSATREELLAAVRTVDRDADRVVVSVGRETLRKLHGRDANLLSRRESEVLSLVARDMTNDQIASRLYISLGTVKRHLTNIYAKLEVSSRREAVEKALSEGLITQRGS